MTFNLKSGNGPLPFKQMGSSPAKQNVAESDSTRVAKPITPKVTGHGSEGVVDTNQKYAEDFFKDASNTAVSGTVEGGKMGLMKKAGKLASTMTKNLVPVEKEEKEEKKSTITDNTSMKPPYKKPVGPTAN